MKAPRTAHWRAMGTDVHVAIVGGTDRHLAAARDRLAALERRWSRDDAESDVSRMNRARGRPVRVTRETRRLVERAVAGWHTTAGRFDPTVLPPYGTSDRAAPPAPGCGAIVVDTSHDRVTLPAGVRIDLGAVARGAAADLLAEDLLERGVAGALVDVGGDLRALGTGPAGDGWVVGIEHAPGSAIVVTNGGAASSATAQHLPGRRTRVIDPATGRPPRAAPDAVTVFAPTATDARIVATAAILAGRRAVDVMAGAGVSGFVLAPGGAVDATPDLRPVAAVGPRATSRDPVR